MTTRIRAEIQAILRPAALPIANEGKWALIILLIAHVQTEISNVLTEIMPGIMTRKVDLFLCPWYTMPYQLNWWVKFLTNDIFEVLVFYAFAKVAKQYSEALFLCLVVMVAYHIIDLIMFLWNFKTSRYLMWDYLFTGFFMIKGLFKNYKPATIAKIKSLF